MLNGSNPSAVVSYPRRKRSNSKDEVQLSRGVFVAGQRVCISEVVVVGLEDRWSMDHRIERRPFLEEDVD